MAATPASRHFLGSTWAAAALGEAAGNAPSVPYGRFDAADHAITPGQQAQRQGQRPARARDAP